MEVTYYQHHDGEPWGLFITGHVDKKQSLNDFNRKASQQGFKAISIESIEHTYGAYDNSEDSDYNFYVVGSENKTAMPITYVNGDQLEYI